MQIDLLAFDINYWANRVFPDRTDASMFLKLYGEVAELIEAGDDCGSEIADILILVLDYAERKNVNLVKAITDKMELNNRREWEVGPGGTMRHVKGKNGE